MSIAGEPAFNYYFFDLISEEPYIERWKQALNAKALADIFNVNSLRIIPCYQTLITSLEQLPNYELKTLILGYEGIMLRSLEGLYKQGRSTTNEGILLKLKRFEDEEATVIGFQELLLNCNPETVDALGYRERSSQKEGLLAGHILGSLIVDSPKFGVFNIGTGFTDKQRYDIWYNRQAYEGRAVTFKYQPHGTLNKPRLPVFKGFREDL